MVSRIPYELRSASPSLVIILGGTNDLGFRTEMEIAKSLQELHFQVHAHNAISVAVTVPYAVKVICDLSLTKIPVS